MRLENRGAAGFVPRRFCFWVRNQEASVKGPRKSNFPEKLCDNILVIVPIVTLGNTESIELELTSAGDTIVEIQEALPKLQRCLSEKWPITEIKLTYKNPCFPPAGGAEAHRQGVSAVLEDGAGTDVRAQLLAAAGAEPVVSKAGGGRRDAVCAGNNEAGRILRGDGGSGGGGGRREEERSFVAALLRMTA